MRVLSRRPLPAREGVEVVVGDLSDPGAVDRAVRGARRVIHLGAAMKGPWADHHAATVRGTDHVALACKRHGVEKLVHVSSLSVLDWVGDGAEGLLDEETAFEPRPEERGSYTRAKLLAERIVRRHVQDHGLPAVILRPGQVFGGDLPLFTPAIGWRLGRTFVMLGDGRRPIPLVYVDDVVRSILLAAECPLSKGEILHVVDAEVLCQDEVVRRAAGPGVRILRVPRWLVLSLGKGSEVVLGLFRRSSPVSVYRLRSAMASRRPESRRARSMLGWEPTVGVAEGIRRVASAER